MSIIWSCISLTRDNGSETIYSILPKPRVNRLLPTTLWHVLLFSWLLYNAGRARNIVIPQLSLSNPCEQCTGTFTVHLHHRLRITTVLHFSLTCGVTSLWKFMGKWLLRVLVDVINACRIIKLNQVLHRYWGFSNAATLSLVIGASNFALVTGKE
jgi:hypothetical protein